MLRRRIEAVAALLLVLAAARSAGAVGVVDPALRFRQIRTPHFIIYYHLGEERLAARLAAIVEPIRVEVGAALGLTLPSRTHVILADQSDVANGWASTVPRDVIFLNATVPSGSEFIGRTDDWLRLVFTHELTHIVHLDRSRGWFRVARGILGRSPFAMPNLWLPQWQVEGLATWEESALTGQGRLRAGDFRAIERLATATGGRLPLGGINGGLVRWPDGHAAYAYGLGFHEYLVGRFGEKSLGALADESARWFPYIGSRAFRRVYGETLGSLWRDYARSISVPEVTSAPPAGPAPVRLTRHGQIVTGPRFMSPTCATCPEEIVYSLQNPDRFPEMRSVTADGSANRSLATRFLGSTAGAGADAIVFDQQELRRNVGLYSDLHHLDRSIGRTTPLTRDGRLRDPDVSSDGRSLVAVRQRGGERDLMIARLDRPAGGRPTVSDFTVLLSEPDVQFSVPRWSPDGRRIAAERRRLGALPEIVLVNATTREVHTLASDRGARIVTPAWKRDGSAVIAAADFDGGPFDLYEFPLDGAGARRLTYTDGAIWPDVSPDGRTLVFAGYTTAGFDLFTFPYPAASQAPRTLEAGGAMADVPQAPLTGEGYRPFRTLAPTSWIPLLTVDDDQTRLGGAVSGADVLGRHAYAAAVTWLVRGPAVSGAASSAIPDWAASYAYTRWRAVPFASASRDTSFLRVRPATGVDERVVREQYELQGGMIVPIVHARHSEQLLASIVDTRPTYSLASEQRTARIVASRFAAATTTARTYGYSISSEDGVSIGATAELARGALGSDGDATTVAVDARAYLPGLARQHVVALRAAGGRSRGAPAALQAFQLGGSAAPAGIIDFGDDLGILRGFGNGAFTGTQLASASGEYRFPFARIERGAGTFPLFLRWAHAAAFVDTGQVWNGDDALGGWKTSWGGELSMDLVAGYLLPITTTVGVAWSADGDTRRGASVYARVGRAF